MNENLANEIRKTIESVKDMKLQVGGINNYLSILEGMIRSDYQKQVDEAYERGYDKGYADKTNNDKVCKDLAKDIYQRGLNDAWEAAKKVVVNPNEGGLDIPALDEIFGCATIQQVFRKYSVSEVIVKLKAYEEELKVRDEVLVYGNRGVVTYICNEDYTVMMYDGSCGKWKRADLKKTGKRHDIDKILKAMGGVENGPTE